MSNVTKIQMYEQVGIGNFAGDTDEEQSKAANNFAEIMTEHMTKYCTENYPDAELEINFSVENVSGCTRKFEAHSTVDSDDTIEELHINEKIELEYQLKCAKLERSGEIYE